MSEPTPRQLQVLTVWIECGGMHEAADRLGLTYSTVQNTLMAIREVLEASSSAQAFAIAVRRGLIDPRKMRIDEAA